MNYRLSPFQIENLQWLANHIEKVAIHDGAFDMKAPYLTTNIMGSKAVVDPADAYHCTPLKRDAMSYLVGREEPRRGETWHRYVERMTGFSDRRNPDAWQYMFGSVCHDLLSAGAVAARIRAILSGLDPAKIVENADDHRITREAKQFIEEHHGEFAQRSLFDIIKDAIRRGMELAK